MTNKNLSNSDRVANAIANISIAILIAIAVVCCGHDCSSEIRKEYYMKSCLEKFSKNECAEKSNMIFPKK